MRDEALFNSIPTPSYVINTDRLKQNLKRLKDVADQSDCRILLAQKAFSAYDFYPLIGRYLSGTAASGIHEAMLGREYMPDGEVHVFSPAFRDDELPAVLGVADHIVFNSFSQWQRFKPAVDVYRHATHKDISIGLRINPGYSEIDVEIYDPAAPGSRLGMTLDAFKHGIETIGVDGIDGIHFHTLCEDSAETLERTLEHVYRDFLPLFAAWPDGLKWFNLGGGHHVTRDDYNRPLLISLLREAKEKTGAIIYIEPGEAIALDAGALVSAVLDTGFNQLHYAILDTSAVCHMPDVLEMPYRPCCRVLYKNKDVAEGLMPGEAAFTYRLGGPTCLAGDIIGDYAFPKHLSAGDRLVFFDMAIYTMVKTNTFNGMPLPTIAKSENGRIEILRTFGYDDFKMRLGSIDR